MPCGLFMRIEQEAINNNKQKDYLQGLYIKTRKQ